jgi:hypothetical protein
MFAMITEAFEFALQPRDSAVMWRKMEQQLCFPPDGGVLGVALFSGDLDHL